MHYQDSASSRGIAKDKVSHHPAKEAQTAAEGCNAHMFRRPQHQNPTCHLHLAPLAVGDTTEDVLRTFEPYGEPTVTAFEGKSHVFVSFATEQQAAAAAAAVLADSRAFKGRQVKLKFAEAKLPRQQQLHRQPLTAVTSVATCGVPGLSLHVDFVTAEEEEVRRRHVAKCCC